MPLDPTKSLHQSKPPLVEPMEARHLDAFDTEIFDTEIFDTEAFDTESANRKIKAVLNENYALTRSVEKLKKHLKAVKNSESWKLTKPLRKLSKNSLKRNKKIIRLAKLVFWTITLQLPKRLKKEKAKRKKAAHYSQTNLRHPIKQFTVLKPPAAFTLATSSKPVLSVIIPTFGQEEFTRLCLYSISRNPPNVPYEVIVLDDNFPAPTQSRKLEGIEGVIFLKNSQNLGFLKSCNAAAKQARGSLLLFLNNDTQVEPKAIDRLTEVFEQESDVGLVGSKLVYPDGSLQEAGGIVFNDANAWNFGRNQNPALPEYNYRRDADYISGAAIVVPATIFHQLGGFDESFAPAYYEDTDLAFRLRQHAYRVIYQPKSVIIHFEGKSHGTDTDTGVKAYQVRNKSLMQERWKSILQRDYFPPVGPTLRARDHAKTKKIILVADHHTLEPDRDAGSRSAKNIIQCLQDLGYIVKFWPFYQRYNPLYTSQLEDIGIEVIDERWGGSYEDYLKLYGQDFDDILLMRPDFASKLIDATLQYTQARLFYYGHDLHFTRMRMQADLEQDNKLFLASIKMEWLERDLWRQFDCVLYPSQEEATLIGQIEPTVNAQALQGFFCSRFCQPVKAPINSTILFVGGFAHPPNIDAAQWLVEDILPLIHAKIPNATIILAGSNPSDQVVALAGDNVEVTGWVSADTLDRLYAEARVAVVPLRFGAGVKGKVIEALANGTPLVTTKIGAQGINGLENIVPVKDRTAELADALVKLLQDDLAWIDQSQNQVKFAKERFSRASMVRSIQKAFASVPEKSVPEKQSRPETDIHLCSSQA